MVNKIGLNIFLNGQNLARVYREIGKRMTKRFLNLEFKKYH